MAIKCEKCGAKCADGVKFCNECGNKLQGPKCPQCKESVQEDDQFCGSCGFALASNVEAPPNEEQQEYDGPWRLTDVAREWLKGIELDEEPELNSAGESTTTFVYTLDELELPVYFEVGEKPELFQIFMYCSAMPIKRTLMGAAKDLLFHLNHGQYRGGLFDIQEDKEGGGMFRYINVIDVEGVAFESGHIENMMNACISVMKERVAWIDAISKGKSVAEALSTE